MSKEEGKKGKKRLPPNYYKPPIATTSDSSEKKDYENLPKSSSRHQSRDQKYRDDEKNESKFLDADKNVYDVVYDPNKQSKMGHPSENNSKHRVRFDNSREYIGSDFRRAHKRSTTPKRRHHAEENQMELEPIHISERVRRTNSVPSRRSQYEEIFDQPDSRYQRVMEDKLSDNAIKYYLNDTKLLRTQSHRSRIDHNNKYMETAFPCDDLEKPGPSRRPTTIYEDSTDMPTSEDRRKKSIDEYQKMAMYDYNKRGINRRGFDENNPEREQNPTMCHHSRSRTDWPSHIRGYHTGNSIRLNQGHVKRPRPYMEREDQALSREQETEQPPENNHNVVCAADSGVVAANETGPPQRSPNTRNEGWWHYITDCVVAKWIPPAPFCMCGARQDCSRPPSELPGELPVSSAISETPQVLLQEQPEVGPQPLLESTNENAIEVYRGSPVPPPQLPPPQLESAGKASIQMSQLKFLAWEIVKIVIMIALMTVGLFFIFIYIIIYFNTQKVPHKKVENEIHDFQHFE